jgi:hypothetical protein
MSNQTTTSSPYIVRPEYGVDNMAWVIINKIKHLLLEVDKFKVLQFDFKWFIYSSNEEMLDIVKQCSTTLAEYIKTYSMKPAAEFTVSFSASSIILIHIEQLALNIYYDDLEHRMCLRYAIETPPRRASVSKNRRGSL